MRRRDRARSATLCGSQSERRWDGVEVARGRKRQTARLKARIGAGSEVGRGIQRKEEGRESGGGVREREVKKDE